MGKLTLSICLENEVIQMLEERSKITPKSEVINKALKKAWGTEQGIKEEIKYHEDRLNKLNQQLKNICNINENKFKNITKEMKEKLESAKNILNKEPEKIHLWVKVINSTFNKDYNSKELEELIRRTIKC